MKTEPYIKLKNISKKYDGATALFPLNLDISKRERIALIGPSGAGKSTLLNILSGSVTSDTGEYLLKDRLFASMNRKERAEGIGLVRQQFDLVEPLKVVHNVLSGHLGRWGLGKSLSSLVVPRNLESARTALSQVGIEDKLFEKTAVLSGGEKQRVALARLLVQNPRVILADEPVASLDPARAEQILDLLVNMADTGEKTLIASLHSVDYAKKYFTRVVGLRQGQIVIDKHVSELTDTDTLALYTLETDAYE